MIIVIDAILSNTKPRGVSRYTEQLILGLAKRDKKNAYYIFYGSWMRKYKFLTVKQPNFHFIEKRIPSNMITRNAYKCFILPLLAKKLHADVFHVTDTSPLLYKTSKVVSTIHDLAEFVMPEKYSRIASFSRRKYLWFQTKISNRILTVSNYTKNQIEKHFPRARGKVTVTYNGVEQEKFANHLQSSQPKEDKPYFLYIGGMEKSKNVPVIVKAFALLPDRMREQYKLRLVGEQSTDTPAIKKAIEEHHLEEQVTLMDYVPEKELVSLYQNAFAFIHPSMYEGFGIPIVEAFAAGIPVIASNATCFPEICRDAALLFEPSDAAGCARHMMALIQSEQLRNELIAGGDQRKTDFEWDNLCQATLECYYQCAEESKEMNRKKITNWLNLKLPILLIIWLKLLVDAGVIYVFRDYLGQHKFYLDAGMIYNYYNLTAGSWLPLKLGDGFGNTARFYRLVFCNYPLSKTAFFLACSFVYAAVYHWMIIKMRIKNKKAFFLFTMIFIFDAVYLYQPSKEITAMILSIILVGILRKNKKGKYGWIAIGIFIYAIVFRIYYLFLLLFFLLYLLYRKDKRYAWIAFCMAMIAFCTIYQTGHLDFLINARVVDVNANTILTDIFPRDAMGENVILYLVNYVIMLVRLIVPIEIFVKSPSRAFLFIPVYWTMLYCVLRGWLLLRKKQSYRRDKTRNMTDSSLCDGNWEACLQDCIVFIIAHILMSALFEPDLGSYFRHVIGILPFYYYVMFE